ncbi:MAG TPA: hypothetical protein VN969_40015 [Streptosporangiaceae bacterium]|nr:hypothetical protein [Streptosporangiaceae bacterium]
MSWRACTPKKVGGNTYWYLREMARVDGRPKMVSERYLGTAAEIGAAVEGADAAARPERSRHLAFRDVAAAGRAPAVRGHLPGAGGAEPAGRALLQGRVRGLVEEHRRGPVRRIPASALDHRRFYAEDGVIPIMM